MTQVDLNHHAFAVIGGSHRAKEILGTLSHKFAISPKGNPDFFERSYITFTIDDAREIKSLHEMRPVHVSGKKIFILSMNGITVEAQNALLKLLEEPSLYAHFFIVIPSTHLLLPTIKSRVQLIDEREKGGVSGARESDERLVSEAKRFLEEPVAKRLETIKTLLDEISKEKKTKQDAIDFLNAVEHEIYSGGLKNKMKQLEAIDTARSYITDRAPSLKMLLEYVALNV